MIDIEKIAINYLLYSPEAIDELIHKGVNESFFFNKVNSTIFKIMLKYKKEFSKNINRIELEAELTNFSIPREVYSEHINMLFDELADITIEWLVKSLFEHKRKQSITEGINKIITNINSNDIDSAEKELQLLNKQIMRIKPNDNLVVDFNNENFLNTIGLNIPNKKIMTGYKEIDAVVNGFMPGELIVVAARPKTGKTRTMVNLIANMIRDKVNVLAFTLEVPKDQYLNLFYSCMSGIPFMKFKDRSLSKSDCEKIAVLQDTLRKDCGKLIIVDTVRSVNPDYIRNKIEEAEAQFNTSFDVIAIDHATMMKANKNYGDDWLDQGSIAMDLRDIGREKGKVMLTAVQIRRSGANVSSKSRKEREPGDELARSDTWFQTLDVLLALSKPESDDNSSSLSTLTIRIQPRHGEIATVNLIKDFSITSLYSIEDPAFKANITSLIPNDDTV